MIINFTSNKRGRDTESNRDKENKTNKTATKARARPNGKTAKNDSKEQTHQKKFYELSHNCITTLAMMNFSITY